MRTPSERRVRANHSRSAEKRTSLARPPPRALVRPRRLPALVSPPPALVMLLRVLARPLKDLVRPPMASTTSTARTLYLHPSCRRWALLGKVPSSLVASSTSSRRLVSIVTTRLSQILASRHFHKNISMIRTMMMILILILMTTIPLGRRDAQRSCG
jgi:hypothetical protein